MISSREGNILYGTSNADNNNTCSVFIEDVLQKIDDSDPSQMNNLIDLVDSVSYALEAIVSKRCNIRDSCQHNIKAYEVNEALKSINFTTRQGKRYAYDKAGGPAYVSYSIEQIQIDENTGKGSYEAIGHWKSQSKSSRLYIDPKKIKFPDWSANGELPSSSCSRNCYPGEKVAAKQHCCWECEKCDTNQVSRTMNSEKCEICPEGFHTKNSVNCELTPIRHITICLLYTSPSPRDS